MSESSLPPTAQEENHYEQRECRSCYGCGTVVEDATYDPMTGELVQEVMDCPSCWGSGEVSVYLYPRRRSNR